MPKEEKLEIQRSGTSGAGAEEFWFMQSNPNRICWIDRYALTTKTDRALDALHALGFTITREQIIKALTEHNE